MAFSLIVIVSAAGSLAAVLMAAPRVYFAMARDGLFFASFGAVDPRRVFPHGPPQSRHHLRRFWP